MTMPTPSAVSVSFTVAELESYQGYIQSAADDYAQVWASLSPGIVKSAMASGCGQLTALIGLLETKIGQTGVLTPSGGTGKGV